AIARHPGCGRVGARHRRGRGRRRLVDLPGRAPGQRRLAGAGRRARGRGGRRGRRGRAACGLGRGGGHAGRRGGAGRLGRAAGRGAVDAGAADRAALRRRPGRHRAGAGGAGRRGGRRAVGRGPGRRRPPGPPERPGAGMTLPVVAVLDELRAALAGRGVAVLPAPPGAGKTTAVPPALLDEPRRGGAPRAAARRMAAVRREPVGEVIGYTTRDERRAGPATRVEVVTEGILTRRLQRDPALEGVGLVVFDEFHERSLQADLGLALALDARRHLRPDLRLLIMSATLDGERVAALLGDGQPAPVVTSEARAHPVEVRWAPRRPGERLEPAVVREVVRALRT